MRNRGVWNPGRNAAICGVIAAAGILALVLGFGEMHALGRETGRASALVVFGLLAGTLGTAMFVNFLRGMRAFREMRSGRSAIARWTVPPEEYERYREVDRRFSERGQDNDYRPPRSVPAEGMEVIFSDDGVLIGNCYFSLSTTGITRFRGVSFIASNPPMIEFGTVLTAVSNITHVRVNRYPGRLRVPVAVEAELQGRRVVHRYEDIINRRVIVKPHFWGGRIKAGFVATVISALLAATGFALRERNQELNNVPLVLAVAGTICAIAGLVLAMVAWGMRQKQHHG